jgi:hypothetical protein
MTKTTKFLSGFGFAGYVFIGAGISAALSGDYALAGALFAAIGLAAASVRAAYV